MVELVIGCAANLLTKVGENLIVQTGRHLGYLIYHKNYIEDLKHQVEKLMIKSQGIKLQVEEAIRNGDIVAPEVERWCTSVNVVCEESTRFLDDEVYENKGFLIKGWWKNIKKRYILSKKAWRKSEEASLLKNEVFHKISYAAPPLGVGERSIGKFKNFESRIPTVEQLMKLLKDDTVQIISICGMGGSGKTTMVNEIATRVKVEKLFDEIVMAIVSKEHDLMKVQEDLAKSLGLKFKAERLEGRANELWKRLRQSKKGNLVILDDVWKHFDLEKIGIPIGQDYKNCKVVLTSRSADICRVMGCREILTLDVLTQFEALSLFEEMIGHDMLHDSDLYETASEIAKRCGGLPIAIVCLGRALKDKRKEVWNDTLLKLQRSIVPTNIEGVKKEVYQSLQASYDLLEDDEAKKLFLLCCIYPEYANVPLEALVRYGMGLEFFKGTDLLIQARDRVHTLTDKLKSCFLLLSGDKRSTVKVHNVVRVVGISVASGVESKIEQFNELVIHDDRWPRGMKYENYNAISIVSNEISELPSHGLNCPKLELLQLSCPKLDLQALGTMFEGMKKLRIVDIWNMSLSSLSLLLLHLPTSIFVLCVDCKMSTIGDITNTDFGDLEILSLGNCDIIELPKEIGKFTNLRMLDMSGCRYLKRISPGVISSLCRLEELDTGSKSWGDEEHDAKLAELKSLSNLIFLGIQIKTLTSLSRNPIFKNLERYVISVGIDRQKYSCSFHKRVILLKLDIMDTHLGGDIDKLLKKNTEKLFLTGDGLKTALKEMIPGGFQHLKTLTVECCNSEGMEHLANCSNAAHDVGFFPNLEKLRMEKMWHLKGILCHDDQWLPARSFGKLRKIHLSVLPAITYLFTQSIAINLVHLETLKIEYCTRMEQVILNPRSLTTSTSTIENKIMLPKLTELIVNYVSLVCFSKGINLQVEFPELKVLKLEHLLNFQTFCAEETNLAFEHNHRGANFRSLVDHKVELSSLAEMTLSNIGNIKAVWCGHLPNVVHLQGLYIQFCHMMEEVIFIQRHSATDLEEHIVFLKLKEVILFGLDKLAFFCRGIDRVEFPQLRVLRLRWLTHFQTFCRDDTSASTSSVFDDKVTFPSLETLEVSELDSINDLWSSQLPTNHFEKLRSLRVDKCHKLVNIFSSHLQTLFPSLERLEVEKCDSLEHVWSSKTLNIRNLKRIIVYECPKLKNLCSLHTFKGLTNLQTLEISHCKMIEEVVGDDHDDGKTKGNLSLNKLENINLEFLPNLEYFSRTRYDIELPELAEIVIVNCPEMRTFSRSSLIAPKLKFANVDGIKS